MVNNTLLRPINLFYKDCKMLFNTFIDQFKQALNRKEFIVFGAECKVNYSGRAETYLAKGQRVIIIKQDSSIQVHQPFGNTPINYMKEGTDHSLRLLPEGLLLSSYNIPLGEFMDITIHKVLFFNKVKIDDGHKLQLTGTEQDMSNMIYENPSIIEKGLKSVKQEEQTQYGFIDLLCNDENNNLVVIECKRFKADFSAVSQLRRYVERVKEIKGINNVRGILATPSITANAEKMLTDYGFKFVKIEPPKYMEKLKRSQKNLSEF